MFLQYGYDMLDPTMFFTGTYLIALVIGIIIDIAISVWVYRDAESRGMSGIGWLLVVLLTGCIGCIIYLIVRKPQQHI